MYRKLIGLILCVFMLVGLFYIPVNAENNIRVFLNGKELNFDVPPQIINGRTMVPMRNVFESLGADVRWEGDRKRIISITPTKKMYMIIDNVWCQCNGIDIKTDVAPVLVDGRTLVPLRFISEQLNQNVEWNEETKTINITSIGETKYETIEEEKVVIGLPLDTRQVYVGETINGKPYGVGEKKIYMADKLLKTMRGCFKNGIMEGFGTYILESDNVSDVQSIQSFFVNGRPSGETVVEGVKGIINGILKDGEKPTFDDVYAESLVSKKSYQGAAYVDERAATGFYFYSDVARFNGLDDTSHYTLDPLAVVPHGKGVFKDSNSYVYDGEFCDGFIVNGTLYSPEGHKRFSGSYNNFSPLKGTMFYSDGRKVEGTFENYLPVNGIAYYKSGAKMFEGTFKDGKINTGKCYNEDGKLIYEGNINDIR